MNRPPGAALWAIRRAVACTVLTAHHVRDLVERMPKISGRRVDVSSPFVDRLPDSSGVRSVLPDLPN